MEWMMTHWRDVVEIALAAVGLASVIFKLTPNTMDDKIAGKLLKLLSLAKK